MLSNKDLLQKANFTTPDLGNALSIEQANKFINLMVLEQEMLKEVSVVTHNSAKWQEATLDFGTRIAKPGVEAAELAAADRVKPTVALIEFSSVFIRGEVPVSDEALEDAMTGAAAFERELRDTIARRFGYDIEDLFINGDTASADTYLALDNGWLKLANGAGGHVVSATNHADTIETLAALVTALPNKWKRDYNNIRFYTARGVEERWRRELIDRGTSLGDLALTNRNALTFQGIPLVGLSNFPVSGSPARSKVLMTHKNNLYAGFRRKVTMEAERQPRFGLTSFLVTARVDAQIASVDATAVANDVLA